METNTKPNPMNKDFLSSSEVMQVLGISRKTFYNMRSKRVISFIQINRKVLVKNSDLRQYMEAHYIRATIN